MHRFFCIFADVLLTLQDKTKCMLDKEFKYFLDNQRDLVKKHPNKYLMIIGNEIVRVYSNHMKAYEEGKKKYGLGNFLIQHCLPGELSTTHTFHSQVTL